MAMSAPNVMPDLQPTGSFGFAHNILEDTWESLLRKPPIRPLSQIAIGSIHTIGVDNGLSKPPFSSNDAASHTFALLEVQGC
jgi:hypothetical protein